MKASVLLDEAISLPVEERAHLVDCLLQTLNLYSCVGEELLVFQRIMPLL